MDGSTIKLDQFLKLAGIAQTGGQAKLIVQGGDVLVNGTLETRRGRKLVSGDNVTVGGQTFKVELNDSWCSFIGGIAVGEILSATNAKNLFKGEVGLFAIAPLSYRTR